MRSDPKISILQKKFQLSFDIDFDFWVHTKRHGLSIFPLKYREHGNYEFLSH